MLLLLVIFNNLFNVYLKSKLLYDTFSIHGVSKSPIKSDYGIEFLLQYVFCYAPFGRNKIIRNNVGSYLSIPDVSRMFFPSLLEELINFIPRLVVNISVRKNCGSDGKFKTIKFAEHGMES